MIKVTMTLFCFQLIIIQLWAQSYVENHLLYSSYLQEDRTISVALPIDYVENNKKYPVLYVLDGEYIFDYAKSTVDFLTNEFGYLPEMIVVGIPNTDRNRDLFVTLNPEDTYTNFVNYLRNEVFSFISKNYRINEFKILYGWSSASGICSYFLSTEPDLIQGYILTGSGIGKRFESLMKDQITKDRIQNNTFLYVNTEQGPREPGLHRFRKLIDSIQPNNLIYRFKIVEQSHVGAMQTGLDAGLKFIFSDFYIPDEITKKGKDTVIKYYQDLTRIYNFDFTVPKGAINETAGILYYQDKKEDAIELLKYGIELYPQFTPFYGSLADIYKSESKNQLAKELYEKALDVSSGNILDSLKYKTLIKEISH